MLLSVGILRNTHTPVRTNEQETGSIRKTLCFCTLEMKTKKEIKKILFIIAPRIIKYLGIRLTVKIAVLLRLIYGFSTVHKKFVVVFFEEIDKQS